MTRGLAVGDRVRSALLPGCGPGVVGTVVSLGGNPRPGEGPFRLTVRWDDDTYCTTARSEVERLGPAGAVANP